MGAVHSTSANGHLQVLEAELATAKRFAEELQAQGVAAQKAAKKSAEAGEAQLTAQLRIARQAAAAAETENAESKKRYQELEQAHEDRKIDNQELQLKISKIRDAQAEERAAFQRSRHLLEDSLNQRKETVDVLKKACQERTAIIENLTKELLEVKAQLGDSLQNRIDTNKNFVVRMTAHNKSMAKSQEREKEMVETIRVLKDGVEKQRGIIEELQKKTKPYWVFDERRY